MTLQRNGHSSGIGGSLILVIFIILTITVFSVLTLVSAQNELNTVKKSKAMSEAYYAAEKTAAEKCGQIGSIMSSNDDLAKKLTALTEIEAEAELIENDGSITFVTEIDNIRSLKTVLKSENGNLTIISQQIISESSINIDDGYEVWDGASPFPVM
ncbi:MAG: hypothetical protein NC203_08855 [Firmicutes bacterium]|nr:hypothetical protein [Bacillota bacterium]